jgi:DinB family protein
MTETGPREFDPGVAARVIEAFGTTIGERLGALPEEVLVFHPAAGQWCVNEVVGHLIEAEGRGFAGRIRVMLEAEDPVFATWDQPSVAAARGDCDKPPADLIRELVALRAESARLVASLSEADLERAGQHPEVGRLRVIDVMHEWIHHDANHERQILANVQTAVWRHMGNSQRF